MLDARVLRSANVSHRVLIEAAGFEVSVATPWTPDAHAVTFVATRDRSYLIDELRDRLKVSGSLGGRCDVSSKRTRGLV